MRRLALLLPLLLPVSTAMAADGPVPLIPRATLFGDAERSAAELSPDGMHYAWLAPDEGFSNIFVAGVGSTEGKALTHDRHRGLYFYFWAPDGKSVMFLSDNDGDENWGLHAVDIATGERRTVFAAPDAQVNVLAVESAHPDEILIEINDRDPLAHDVHRVDLATGTHTMVAENPGRVRFWIIDPQLRVRGMHVSNEDGSFDFLVRDDEASEWRNVAHWELEDAITSRPIGFSTDGRSAYLLDSRGRNTGALVELDLASGDTKVLFEDPDHDLGDVFFVNLLRHPVTGDLQAIAWMRDRRAWHALDPAFEPHLAALRDLHEGDFTIGSRSADDGVWFVHYDDDDSPGAYYAYDTASRTATLLFEDAPEFAELPLAACEPFSFEARDGLVIHGYLTFPVGVPRENLPTVMNIHGGPWFRDNWGMDVEDQWLANRGYLAINVNYRASTTYGKKSINAADHEWGRAMIQDVIDAARWSAAQGYTDPERVAIYGWSFGGYQALCGAAFGEDTFACAVDCVGPANLITFMNSFPPQWETRKPRFYLRGGHPDRDQEMLIERSPYHHADNIRIPMLIAQGAHDPRVKQAESDQIVAKLEENGVEHTYLLFENEGHGFYAPENRERFYSEAEAFLAKHLGGRVETKSP